MRKKSHKNFLSRFKKVLVQNKTEIISCISLFIVHGLFFLPTFAHKDFTGDFIGQEVSWYHFTFVNLKQGILPWWSPYAFSGIPHLLKPELAIFHPFTLLTMFLNLLINRGQTIGITGQLMEIVSVFSLAVAASGVYLFSRKILSLSSVASLFAALAYALNPFTIFQIHSTTVLDGVTLLPWLMFFLVRFINSPSFITFFFLVLGNYLLLIGYTYHYIYFFFMELSLILVLNYRKTLHFFLAFGAALLISCIFLTSYADIYAHSPRNENNYDIAFHSFAALSPVKIAEIFSPISLSSTQTTSEFTALFAGPTLTWGTFAFVFLIYGLFAFKKQRIYVWIAGIFFLSLFYSFGGNLQTHNFFGNLVPLIYKLRFHARVFIVIIFAGALLIGLGVQAIQEQRRIKFIEFFFWILLLVLLSGLLLGELYFPQRITNNSEILKGFTTTLLFLFSSLVIIALSFRFAGKGFLYIGLIVMCIELNLFFQNFTDFFTKNITYDQFYKINSLIPEMPSKNNLFRMYFEDDQFAYNTSVFGIYNSNGYENNPSPTINERYNRYGVVRFYETTNVKYVVTTTDNWQSQYPDVVKIKTIVPQNLPNETYFHSPDKNHYIYLLKNYLPRFYVPGQVLSCDNGACILKDNPPKVVVAKGLPEKIVNPEKNVSIQVEEFSPNTVKLKVNAPKKTYVASSEIWDKGWHMKVNNQTATIYDTSNGLRGFIVPPGKTEVVMNYFPPRLFIGAILSIIGIVLLFVIWKTKLIERSDTIIYNIYRKLRNVT